MGSARVGMTGSRATRQLEVRWKGMTSRACPASRKSLWKRWSHLGGEAAEAAWRAGWTWLSVYSASRRRRASPRGRESSGGASRTDGQAAEARHGRNAVEAASFGKRRKRRKGRAEAGQSSKPKGPWFIWWKRQRGAGERSLSVSFGKRSSEAPGRRQAGSGFRTWAMLRWDYGEGRLRHPVAVVSRAERKRSELLRYGGAERGRSCLATSSSGRRKPCSAEASPERRCRKALKGN